MSLFRFSPVFRVFCRPLFFSVIERVADARSPVHTSCLSSSSAVWFVVLEEQLPSPQRGLQPQLAAAPLMTKVFGSFKFLRQSLYCLLLYNFTSNILLVIPVLKNYVYFSKI